MLTLLSLRVLLTKHSYRDVFRFHDLRHSAGTCPTVCAQVAVDKWKCGITGRKLVGAWGFEPQTPTVSITLINLNNIGCFLVIGSPPDQLPDQFVEETEE